MNNIFITGMMRSGTTLLQKALNQHPGLSISYQDKTVNFLDIIKKFHGHLNISKYHLLSHYSPNNDYSLAELTAWLELKADLRVFFPPVTDDSLNFGMKEVLTEEFLPFFTHRQVKCINIIRDPRDVITSMSFGNGFEHTGSERPILFDLRNWRKSVLISEYLERSSYLLTIRMEDLLLNPADTLRKVYKFLEVDDFSFDVLISKLKKSAWKGNSSFGERKAFDPSVIGNYKSALPTDVVEYVETVCFKEMQMMNYTLNNNNSNVEVLTNFKEPFSVTRDEFEKGYTSLDSNIQYELARANLTLTETINRELLGL